MTSEDASGIADHMDNIREKNSSGFKGPVICFLKLKYSTGLALTIQVSLGQYMDSSSNFIFRFPKT